MEVWKGNDILTNQCGRYITLASPGTASRQSRLSPATVSERSIDCAIEHRNQVLIVSPASLQITCEDMKVAYMAVTAGYPLHPVINRRSSWDLARLAESPIESEGWQILSINMTDMVVEGKLSSSDKAKISKRIKILPPLFLRDATSRSGSIPRCSSRRRSISTSLSTSFCAPRA
jgi:hypothetical protein